MLHRPALLLHRPALLLPPLLRRAGPAPRRHCHGQQGSGSHPGSGSDSGSARSQPPEPSLLRFLVCPLSKRPLR